MSEVDSILKSAAGEELQKRLEILEEAARRFGRDASVLCAWAAALKESGRMEEAGTAAMRAIQVKPDMAEAYAVLGEVSLLQHKLERAAQAWETALRLEPKRAQWWASYGDTLGHSGKLAAAEAAFARELALRPNEGRALVDMGRTFEMRERLKEAEAWFRLATVRSPGYVQAWHRLGVVLGKQGLLEQALEVFGQAVKMDPGAVEIWHDIGVANEKLERMEAGGRAYQRAVELKPGDAGEWAALGRNLRLQQRLEESALAFDRSLELEPLNAMTRGEQAILTLQMGDFVRGWERYECRFDAPNFPGGRRQFNVPRWEGQPLAGKTITLWAEQGLGDMIQFVRFVPMVAALGGRVIVETPRGLERLVARVEGVSGMVVCGQPWPGCDYQIGLMSLPLMFKTLETTIPRKVPYLKVDEGVRQAWAGRVGARGNGRRRIGVAWAGSPVNALDKLRSVRLEMMRPFLELEGIEWFSLQKGPAEKQITETGLKLWNLMGEAGDFMETAGLIEQMDLVVTVCTSVAHLSGAIGKPTWVLLSNRACWRWMLRREDSPWYPGMRLFRQEVGGEWAAVMEKVRDELRS